MPLACILALLLYGARAVNLIRGLVTSLEKNLGLGDYLWSSKTILNPSFFTITRPPPPTPAKKEKKTQVLMSRLNYDEICARTDLLGKTLISSWLHGKMWGESYCWPQFSRCRNNIFNTHKTLEWLTNNRRELSLALTCSKNLSTVTWFQIR